MLNVSQTNAFLDYPYLTPSFYQTLSRSFATVERQERKMCPLYYAGRRLHRPSLLSPRPVEPLSLGVTPPRKVLAGILPNVLQPRELVS